MAEQQLRVRLLALTQGFNQNMSAAQSRLTAFGTKAKQVGDSLRSIQLPLALAAGAAVKMALDFNKSMTMIKSLVGVAGDEVDAMGVAAKKMAVDTGQSANAAAEALFFITSAGLRGAEAMQVLEASLKASAVGLGETKTVADLATSAMNAYGSDVLSATDATDVLVTAVREGKLEADQLAQSFGSVLPVASAMGVRFDELGAAFAALSRTGTNAAEASTQIRGILTSLLKPTTDAEKALSEMGLSSKGLREQIKEKGLLSTLETLKQQFDGNDDAAQRVFGNVRALSGIMDLLGAGIDTTRAIFDSLTNSAGATEKAFKITTETLGFQFKKAINEVSVELTEMGEVILKELVPLIKDLSKFIVDLLKDFSELDQGTKKFILTLGGIVIIAPTVITAIGTITTAVASLSKGLIALAASNPVIAALAALGFLGIKAADELTSKVAPDVGLFERLKIAVVGLIDPYVAVNNLITAQVAASKEAKTALEGNADAVDKLNDSLSKTVDVSISAAGGGIDKIITKPLRDAVKTMDAIHKGLTEVGESIKGAKIKDEIIKIGESFKFLSQQTMGFFLQVGNSLQNAFMQMMQGESIIESLGRMIRDLVKRLLAAAAAAAIVASIISAITGAPFSVTFKGTFGALSGFGGGALPVSQSIQPSMGNLGISGAMRNDNISLSGQFRIDGQDLVVAVERANNQRSNFTG